MADEKVTVEVEIESKLALEEMNALAKKYEKLLKAIQKAVDETDKKTRKSLWERFAYGKGLAKYGAERMEQNFKDLGKATGKRAVSGARAMSQRRGASVGVNLAVSGAGKVIQSVVPAGAAAKIAGPMAGVALGMGVAESILPKLMEFLEGWLPDAMVESDTWKWMEAQVTTASAEITNLNAMILGPMKGGYKLAELMQASGRLGGAIGAAGVPGQRRAEWGVLSEFFKGEHQAKRTFQKHREEEYWRMWAEAGRIITTR
jgi:hypothetical protein